MVRPVTRNISPEILRPLVQAIREKRVDICYTTLSEKKKGFLESGSHARLFVAIYNVLEELSSTYVIDFSYSYKSIKARSAGWSTISNPCSPFLMKPLSNRSLTALRYTLLDVPNRSAS